MCVLLIDQFIYSNKQVTKTVYAAIMYYNANKQ